ncbi:single-stranded DNA-binding protein [uncultured Clostridium sp.]|uniref:single-stranded DNA-binding protein n=1 Tax=uncultured Clostridium sp. TaxID=59620 RepID=UPI0025F56FC1|nr:single-stranded DNA-binding protein [uncultured Clostridium sp.]
MNKVLEIGRMTKDPELRYLPGSGTAVTSFSIAVDDGFGDNKKTYFFNVVVFGKSAEAVANYTHKGSKVAVMGKLTTRTWDAQDGTKRYATEIVADNFGGIEFLDNKSDNQNSSQGYNNNQGSGSDGTGNYDYSEDMTLVDSDEMPF